MSKEKTAVQWFYEKLEDIVPDGYRERLEIMVKEAKELEKQQIIDAFGDGFSSDFKTSEKYYTDKFCN